MSQNPSLTYDVLGLNYMDFQYLDYLTSAENPDLDRGVLNVPEEALKKVVAKLHVGQLDLSILTSAM